MQKYFTLIISVLLLASCNKWLDVKPESQVAEDELFSTESGFMDALNGVYSASAERNLYGIELSAGLPEVLAQNYYMGATDALGYKESSLYNYKNPIFISKKDAIWRGMYTAIANCNLILEKLDLRTAPMSTASYNLIKGEALALRAYLHLDLLRLFGPSFATGATAKSIPYVTSFSNKVTSLSTVTEALNKMADDLTAAKTLLKTADPIVTAAYKVGYTYTVDSSTEMRSTTLFLQNRRHRLNYYGVCATLARVYLNLDKKTEALANAKEVIDAKKFPWIKQQDFINSDNTKKDRILYPELIFCWFDNRYKVDYAALFEAGLVGFYMSVASGDIIYEKSGAGGEDLRYKQWLLAINDNSGSRYLLQKYKREPETNIHPLVHPAIRLSEVYYIAAESSWDTDPATALSYLNTVRLNRGISSLISTTSKQVFMDELVKEVRKETYGEGQLFYLYKRLNRGIVGEAGSIIVPDAKKFVLPLPNDELEYGQR